MLISPNLGHSRGVLQSVEICKATPENPEHNAIIYVFDELFTPNQPLVLVGEDFKTDVPCELVNHEQS